MIIDIKQQPRQRCLLNKNWIFSYTHEGNLINENISIPHTHKELPYNAFDEKDYQFVSTYETNFSFTSDLGSKRVILNFEGVMTYAKVWVNDIEVGEHYGGYTPFHFDITNHLRIGAENLLKVNVDGTERNDIPPFGFVIDYLTYAGIYRDVYLDLVDTVSIEKVKTKTDQVMTDSKCLISDVFIYVPEEVKLSLLELESALNHKLLIMALYTQEGQYIASTSQGINLIKAEKNEPFQLQLSDLQGVERWGLDSPYLYDLRFFMTDWTVVLETEWLNAPDKETWINSACITEIFSHTVGFRTQRFTSDGFFLNEKKVILRGLNRHQSYPYVGYAMPKRAQRDDADLLKYELGLNCVRTSHYPQSVDFLNRCDEIGLLVFEEMPGWQHMGDQAWQDVACQGIEEMINRDFNHPSIILWGVRINESGDNHDFYTRTNALAHQLDSTRQTGGVRCITQSEFLEDVYTFNDFVLGNPLDIDGRILRPQLEATGLTEPVPYLVTEYAGHMYPTKRFDQIQRQEEHVRKHLAVMNETALTPYTSGSIGWCAFDYNTHYQFGSGDRICYHGVMDMFRIPKFASFGYTSQMDPKVKLVLEPVLIYAMGEKNLGGVTPMTILTNVDYVDYFVGEKLFGRYYPAKAKYPGLAHPPILIEGIADVWGSGFEDVSFIGYIDHRKVIQKNYIKNPVLSGLRLTADHMELTSEEADTTRIVVEGIDQIGNLTSYADVVVQIDVDGPATLIGPSVFNLIGGCRGFWIRTHFEPGEVTISATILGRENLKKVHGLKINVK